MSIKLSKEQEEFIPWFLSNKSRCLKLIGYAGTGKTTVLKELKKVLPEKKTIWCAQTHTAKQVLNDKLGECTNIGTIASVLGLAPKIINGKKIFVPGRKSIINKIHESGKDRNHDIYLIIDEASMISKEYLNFFLESKADTILFVGDDAQIPPINEIVSPIFTNEYDFPEYRLNTIYRQGKDSPIISLASDTRMGIGNTSAQHGIETWNFSPDNIIRFFDENPKGKALCFTHPVKDKINKGVLMHYFGHDDPFTKGANLMLESPINSKNDFNAPKNGETVTITDIYPDEIFLGFKVKSLKINNKYDVFIPIDENERKTIERESESLEKEYKNPKTSDLRKIEINNTIEIISNKIVFASCGYAMTLHKSQGQTIKDVLLVLEDYSAFKNKNTHIQMIYTGITRASKKLILCRKVL